MSITCASPRWPRCCSQALLASVFGAVASPVARAGSCDGPSYTSAIQPLYVNATGFASGDVNADGRPDVVAVSGWSLSGELKYFANVEGVGLVEASLSLECDNPQEALLVDVNADGRADLVAACPTSDGVFVALSTPWLGGFANPILFPSGASPWSVAAADLDGDGFPDLAIANAGASSITILRNIGPGWFVPWQSIATNQNPTTVRLADLDVDGDADLLGAHAWPDAMTDGDVLNWWRNDGRGVLVPQPGVPICPAPRAVRIGDIDGDGMPDIAALESDGDSMWVVRRDAGGGFAEPQAWTVGADPRDLRLGDVDADGDLDAVVAVAQAGEVLLLRNLVGDFAPAVPISTASDGLAIDLLDVDMDGRLDLLNGRSQGAAWMELLPGRDGGFLTAPSISPTPEMPGIRGTALADVDHDGDLDLLLAIAGNDFRPPFESPAMVVAFNEQGTFLRTSVHPFEATGDVADITVADLDVDGAVDVVVAHGNGAKIWHGDGSGGFVGPETPWLSQFGGATVVHAVDLDADGDLDLVVPEKLAGTWLWRQRDGGTFELAGSVGTSGTARAAAIADFDGDMLPDVALAGVWHVFVHRNLGAFDFDLLAEVPHVVSGPTLILDLAAADLDRDGDADLGVAAASSNFPGRFRVITNEGGRFLLQPAAYTEDGGAARLWFHDVNGDDIPDAVIGRGAFSMPPYGSRLAIRLGAGDSTFGPASLHGPLGPGLRVASGDLNGDGSVDFLLAPPSEGQMAIFFSRCGCAEDLDDSGDVSAQDLELLLSAWGRAGSTDLDGDGDTGAADLGQLLGRWGPCPALCLDC